MSDTKTPVLWERQPIDTNESWEAFKAYRDMRPHRIRNVVGWPTAQVQTWSKEHAWEQRVRAFDAFLDETYRHEIAETLKQSAREVGAEHMGMLATARQICSLELAKILDVTMKGGSAPGAAMKVAEVIKLSELVIKMDRLVRGEATELSGTAVDLSKLSDSELEAYHAIVEKIETEPVTAH